MSQERMYIIHLLILFTFRCLANLRHFVLVSIVTYKKKKDLTTFYNNSFFVRRVHEWSHLEDSIVSATSLEAFRACLSPTKYNRFPPLTLPKNRLQFNVFDTDTEHDHPQKYHSTCHVIWPQECDFYVGISLNTTMHTWIYSILC